MFSIFKQAKRSKKVDEEVAQESQSNEAQDVQEVLVVEPANNNPSFPDIYDEEELESDETDGEEFVQQKRNPKKPQDFKMDWMQSYKWIENSKKKGFFHCNYCDSEKKIGQMGEASIIRHLSSDKHKQAEKAANQSQQLSAFVFVRNSQEVEKIAATELTLTLFLAKHNNSFHSAMCSSELIPQLFMDSRIAQGYAAAERKTAKLVMNVLYPHFQKTLVNSIMQNGGYYSVGLDASNHKECKIHALVVRYFDEKGIHTAPLELVQMASEKAMNMASMLRTTLVKWGLDPMKLISFTADNTNSNFGGVNRGDGKNVYAILKRELKPNLIGIGCLSHIWSNTAQNASAFLYMSGLDFEGFALKHSAHFSSNASRWERFVEIGEECGIAVRQFPKHATTRWLTLQPLIVRILEQWLPLSIYFQEVEAGCLQEYYKNEKLSSEVKVVLQFAAFALDKFNKGNAMSQAKDFTVADAIKMVQRFRQQLYDFQESSFFGEVVEESLSELDEKIPGWRNRLSTLFNEFYRRSLEYLDKWAAPLEELTHLDWLELGENFTHRNIIASYKKFIGGSSDQCFLDVSEAIINIRELNKRDAFQSLLSLEKWIVLFKSNGMLELKKVVRALLSPFPSNAYCETVFSLVKRIWTDERNRLQVPTVNALVSIKCAPLQCEEAFDYFLRNKDLLKKAQSSGKY